jgi:UDP:flavonoid glycosyltransferase YjiC (YdhE family)
MRRPVRITILTTGSRGDVQPYVALALGLKRAGHVVRLPAHETFRELIAGHGFDFYPLEGENPQDFIRRPAIQAALSSGDHLRLFAIVLREAGPLFEGIFDDFWHNCQDTDVVISTTAFFGAYDGAQKLGLPCIHTLLNPMYPTAAFPNPFLAILSGFGRAGNRLTHFLLDQVWWQTFRVTLNRWRKRRLGLPPHPFFGPYHRMRRVDRLPTLFGFSPAVIPPPPDWPPWNHVTGYWFLPPPEGWQPPPALLRFLQDGPPPVYIGFGSMSDESPERLAQVAVQALDRCDQRGVLLSGWGGLDTTNLPGTVFALRSIPHAWLFPRMAAVVHHGGAGTTAASLRAGVPTIVVPFVGDQVFWGRRVHDDLGVGPRPILHRQLNAERLAAAITAALTDRDMRARAKRLGATIRAEDGVARAVEIIDRVAVGGTDDQRL